MVPTLVCIQDVLKVKVEVKVHVMRAFLWFHKKNKIASFPGKSLDREQTHSFANLPFPFSFPISSAPQSQMAVTFDLQW